MIFICFEFPLDFFLNRRRRGRRRCGKGYEKSNNVRKVLRFHRVMQLRFILFGGTTTTIVCGIFH
ncbi:hypothetical protein IC582_027280 [Cucumis melo]